MKPSTPIVSMLLKILRAPVERRGRIVDECIDPELRRRAHALIRAECEANIAISTKAYYAVDLSDDPDEEELGRVIHLFDALDQEG